MKKSELRKLIKEELLKEATFKLDDEASKFLVFRALKYFKSGSSKDANRGNFTTEQIDSIKV